MLSKEVFGLLSEFLKNGEKVLEVGCGTGNLAANLIDDNVIKKIVCINDESWKGNGPKWKFLYHNEEKYKDKLIYENKKFSEVTEKYDRVFFINSFQFLFDDDNGILDPNKVEQVESKLHEILLPEGKAFVYTSSFSEFIKKDKLMVARKVLFSMGAMNYFAKFNIEKYAIGDQMISILSKRD